MEWIFIFAVVFTLAAVARQNSEELRAEWKEEEERKARVKALYPDPPSYEERMGVQYGSQDENEE